jgi:flagellar assembly factor FliW
MLNLYREKLTSKQTIILKLKPQSKHLILNVDINLKTQSESLTINLILKT